MMNELNASLQSLIKGNGRTAPPSRIAQLGDDPTFGSLLVDMLKADPQASSQPRAPAVSAASTNSSTDDLGYSEGRRKLASNEAGASNENATRDAAEPRDPNASRADLRASDQLQQTRLAQTRLNDRNVETRRAANRAGELANSVGTKTALSTDQQGKSAAAGKGKNKQETPEVDATPGNVLAVLAGLAPNSPTQTDTTDTLSAADRQAHEASHVRGLPNTNANANVVQTLKIGPEGVQIVGEGLVDPNSTNGDANGGTNDSTLNHLLGGAKKMLEHPLDTLGEAARSVSQGVTQTLENAVKRLQGVNSKASESAPVSNGASLDTSRQQPMLAPELALQATGSMTNTTTVDNDLTSSTLSNTDRPTPVISPATAPVATVVAALQNQSANLDTSTLSRFAATADDPAGKTLTAVGALSGNVSTATGLQSVRAGESDLRAQMDAQLRLSFEGQPGSDLFENETLQTVKTMQEDGLQRAEITLKPAELGPVEIRLEIADGMAHIRFEADHAQTREALDQALPQLKDMLADQGISLGQTSVDARQQQDPSSQQQRFAQYRSEPREQRAPQAAPSVAATTTRAQRSQGALDVYA